MFVHAQQKQIISRVFAIQINSDGFVHTDRVGICFIDACKMQKERKSLLAFDLWWKKGVYPLIPVT